MPTITIPKKLANKNDLVVIPRQEYEELLSLKKIIPIIKPTQSELRAIARGRKEIREGKYVTWQALKHELASSRNKHSKKAV